MPINKFGLMEDAEHSSSTTTIQPLRKYAINLDDLENVEGFNEEGQKNSMYGFKLADKGIYIRNEIEVMTHDGIERKPLIFVYEENKWNAIPAKYEWDIDIVLKPMTFFISRGVVAIINSGTIFVKITSLPAKDLIGNAVLMRRSDEKGYCISSPEKKEAHLKFEIEHSQDKEIINNPPVGSTIIIEGKIRKKSEEKEILPGLLIGSPNRSNYDFTIIIFKEDSKDTLIKYGIRFVTPGIRITQVENQTISLNTIKIHDFYYICRIRLTTESVSDNEIKYL